MMTMNDMNADVLAEWPTWRNTLIIHLTRREYTGDQIGDVLKEVQSYVDETGETPADAFGDAKTYAKQRSIDPADRPIGWRESRTILQFAGIIVSGGLMVGSSILMMMKITFPFDVPPTTGTVAGAIILIIFSMATPRVGIRDPQTGQSMMQENDRKVRMLISTFLVFMAIIFVATLMRNIT